MAPAGSGEDGGGRFRRRLEEFRRLDDERNEMVAELISEYDELQAKFGALEVRFTNESESRELYQSRNRALKIAAESNPMVYVAIDGDGAVFRDDLLAQGTDGGEKAAYLLAGEIRKKLQAQHADELVPDWKIMAQVFFNMEGLGNALVRCGIIGAKQQLVDFMRGFTSGHGLFSTVDVGPGKERADHKIHEMFSLMATAVQCRHIFVACCHDYGYKTILDEYKHNKDMISKLILIETTPARPGFQKLPFQRVGWPDVFRSVELPGDPQSTTSQAGVVGPRGPPSPVKTSLLGSALPPATWADAVVRNGASEAAGRQRTSGTAPRHYLVNRDGQRIDEPLPNFDKEDEKSYNKKMKIYGKFCNNYYLLGKCNGKGSSCQHYHGPTTLSPGEKLVVRHLARSGKCPRETACQDVDCIAGHHCKYGLKCKKIPCVFRKTHNMDITPAKKIYEDGTEKKIP